MPFIKNLKDKICLAFETEVAALEKVGWTILTDAEELIHREELRLAPELTSAASQEAARVAAGIYKVVTTEVPAAANAVVNDVKTVAKSVTAPAKASTKKAPKNVE